MSLTVETDSEASAPTGSGRQSRDMALRLVLALAALGLVAAILSLVAFWLAGASAPPPPTRTPFGVGVREAAPAATGLSGLILAWQASFYRSLTAALAAMRDGGGPAALIGLSFAYGVFHAAGPGHGKAVISAYLVANDSAWRRGVGLSLGASLVQGLVAFAVVGVVAIVVGGTAAQMTRTTNVIESVSFAALSLFGLWLLWRQSGRLLDAWQGLAPAHACADCHHAPLAPGTPTSWRETAGIVLAAGLRPCTGAVVVLVFALSQGLLAAGAAAVLAMSLGTAVTTSALATLAVFAKGSALWLASGRPGFSARLGAALELMAAALVAALGLTLLWVLGLGSGGN